MEQNTQSFWSVTPSKTLNRFQVSIIGLTTDEAILNHRKIDISDYRKNDEIPYDFIRKRLGISVIYDHEHLIIPKGTLSISWKYVQRRRQKMEELSK